MRMSAWILRRALLVVAALSSAAALTAAGTLAMFTSVAQGASPSGSAGSVILRALSPRRRRDRARPWWSPLGPPR